MDLLHPPAETDNVAHHHVAVQMIGADHHHHSGLHHQLAQMDLNQKKQTDHMNIHHHLARMNHASLHQDLMAVPVHLTKVHHNHHQISMDHQDHLIIPNSDHSVGLDHMEVSKHTVDPVDRKMLLFCWLYYHNQTRKAQFNTYATLLNALR
jgi:methylase of polypeptide subunit release factors